MRKSAPPHAPSLVRLLVVAALVLLALVLGSWLASLTVASIPPA